MAVEKLEGCDDRSLVRQADAEAFVAKVNRAIETAA